MNEDHTAVKLVSIPVEARAGKCVTVPGVDYGLEGAAPFAENKIGKQKLFEKDSAFSQDGQVRCSGVLQQAAPDKCGGVT